MATGRFNKVNFTGGLTVTDEGRGEITVSGRGTADDSIFDEVGDLVAGTGVDTAARVPVGTDGQVLVADSGEATGVRWETPVTTTVADDVIFEDKGDIVAATGDDAAVVVPVGTNGQVLTADSGETAGVKWEDLPAVVAPHILLADGHGTPITFNDMLQMDDGSDFMYSDPE